MGDAPARPKKVLSDSRDDTGISRQAKNASVLTFVIEGKETVEIGNALDAPGNRRKIGPSLRPPDPDPLRPGQRAPAFYNR